MKKSHATIAETHPDISYDDWCREEVKYKIYARKSTEDEGRQVRSIGDQITDCQALAKRLGLTVVGEPIRETKSAMEADNRPLFSELLKEIKTGKISGIIAWHPDRLARNSVESGKIIDMLDKHEIKDLRFHSHTFSNDPNGKMLLGMLFVFAKHYSDDLGLKVRSAVGKRFKEGLSGGTPKHGYIQHNGRYEPDHHGNDNFKLIRTAWEMRMAGQEYPAISEYLRANDYEKHYHPEDKATGGRVDEWRKMKMDDSTLSRMFNDPFYYGILNQAEQTVDLTDPALGLDFRPVVTKDEFMQVKDLVPESKRGKDKRKDIFLPCRNRVFCDLCHDTRPMSVYKTGKKKSGGSQYLYFRCRNPKCPRKKREIRGHIIFDNITEILPEVFSRLSKDAYATYLEETKELSKTAKKALRSEITVDKTRIEQLRKRNDDLAEQITKLDDPRMIDERNEKISINLDAIDEISKRIAKNEKKLAERSDVGKRYTPEEFEEKIKNVPKQFEKASIVRKDLILREIFSNFYFDQEKIVAFSVKEPFATLLNVKTDDVVSLGGGWEIRTPAPGLPRLTI